MEFREWMEKIWEYCQEHWIGLIAAGLVVLILLLSAWLVRLARRDPQEEVALSELQPESEPLLQCEPEPEPEAETEPKPELESEPEDEGKQEEPILEEISMKDETYELLDVLKSINDRISEERSAEHVESTAETEDVAEKEAVPAETVARGLVTQIIRGAEKAGEAAGREVDSIHLEIEKARLVIRYTDRKEEIQEPSEVISSEEKVLNPDSKENRQPVEQETEIAPDFSKQQGIPKKFGLDNMNRARSGRVYTEEELREMIKE
ncbi:MAG: hypothetical protein ACI4LQ_08610 [Anaerovoracaceae bacterium]